MCQQVNSDNARSYLVSTCCARSKDACSWYLRCHFGVRVITGQNNVLTAMRKAEEVFTARYGDRPRTLNLLALVTYSRPVGETTAIVNAATRIKSVS